MTRAPRLSALARAGHLDALMDLINEAPSEEPDQMAYEWLSVAADFGHDDAPATRPGS